MPWEALKKSAIASNALSHVFRANWFRAQPNAGRSHRGRRKGIRTSVLLQPTFDNGRRDENDSARQLGIAEQKVENMENEVKTMKFAALNVDREGHQTS